MDIKLSGISSPFFEGAHLDYLFFSLSLSTRSMSPIPVTESPEWELWLVERKEEIIGKLNKDFAKPWLGWKKDLGDMTYEETVLRMVR